MFKNIRGNTIFLNTSKNKKRKARFQAFLPKFLQRQKAQILRYFDFYSIHPFPTHTKNAIPFIAFQDSNYTGVHPSF